MTNDDQPNIPVGQPAPFSAIRRTIINTFKIGKSPKPAEPIIRPEGLDTRLDPALAADLDTLDPNGNEALQLLFKVTDSIEFELEAIDQITRPVDLISEPRRIVIVAYWIENEINNGGLAQYYLNSSGDNAAIAPDLLRKIDLPDLASIIERANAFFPNANPPRDRAERLDILDEVEEQAEDAWDELTSEFYQKNIICQPAIIKLIRENKNDFFKLDNE